jgi:hypothetical protein
MQFNTQTDLREYYRLRKQRHEAEDRFWRNLGAVAFVAALALLVWLETI